MTESSALRFDRKVAIVTGATRGIGRAVAQLLVAGGARVVLNARGQEALEAMRDELSIGPGALSIVAGDAAEPSVIQGLVDSAMENFGSIDILVNNAGGGRASASLDDIGIDQYQAILSSNLQSAFFLSQAVLPAMRAQAYGRIVNVSSLAGRQHSLLAGADYAAAKAGMLGLTRQMAWEVGSSGITVNAVAPGVTATERVAAKWQQRSAEYRAEVLGGIPLGRIGDPVEVAQAIAFLASDEASYITGVTLDVNGGSFMP
jgi:3-oxoacyl-[acyl-carrier protein] reductase